MATPVGAILCVGMLGLSTIILVVATVASAFVTIPVENWDSTALRPHPGGVAPAGAQHFTTAA